jgi:long-chain acyl-CoA synthetase
MSATISKYWEISEKRSTLSCTPGEDAIQAVNLGKLLHHSAERTPQKPAVICGEQTVSYEALDHSTEVLARWLIHQGCKPGDRVTLHWPNSIEMVTLLFGCFKAGLIAVPVNVRLKAPEIAYILAHSKPAICFAHPDLIGAAKEAYGGLAPSHKLQLSVKDLAHSNGNLELPSVSDDDPALILYTSGTTARPKGVTHTHRTLLEGAKLTCGAGAGSMRTVLVMGQLAYMSAHVGGLLPAVTAGATSVLMSAFDAPAVLDTVERFHCTFAFALPSMVQLLIEEQARQPRQVSSLRNFLAGGDAVPEIIQQRFRVLFGIPIREAYGMTEIGPGICNPANTIRSGSLGKPLVGVEVRVVDSNNNDAADGQIGEMAVRGPANFVGYWGDPTATQEAVRGGWLYTGDLARRDAEGYLWFEGRKKEIIVRDGLNISPQEVEEAIYRHPAVLEVAVIGLPDSVPARGEQVVAFVALRHGMVADQRDLRECALQRLADFKVPQKIVFMDSLPKGITGKVQRRTVKEMASHSVA